MRPISACCLCLLFVSSVLAKPPNIVLLMGDDHGWEETGYNGHPHVITPVLDEMSERGLRMDRFYAAHSSCSPTRGSVMTGRHPNRYGTFAPNWSIRPEEITIAHLLSKAGYRCAHFGKWHLGPVKSQSPTNPGAMGFDTWISHDNFFELNPTLSRNGGTPERFDGESSEIIVNLALDYIRESQEAEKPFFVVVWFGSPHEPYSGLAKDLALYDELPSKYNDRQVKLTSNETGQAVKRPLGDVLRERYAEITAMDRSIGMLRETLQRDGIADRTLIWYCGDNGTPSSGLLASPLRGQKGQVYEGGIRVPGVIEWPERINSPRQSSVPSVTSDILPTLCQIAGVPLPQRPLDGVNVSGLFDGSMTEREQPICFWQFRRPTIGPESRPWIEPSLQKGTTPLVKLMRGEPTRTFTNIHQPPPTDGDYEGDRAIISGRYKLVVTGKAEEPSLYDLHADQDESIDVASQRPNESSRLTEELKSWQSDVLSSLRGNDYPRSDLTQ